MPYESISLISPIEFALVGPAGGRDRVLVRSENAGLDLIGLAAQDWSSKERSPPDLLTVFFGESRQLNKIHSFRLPDVSPHSDPRKSGFSFAWRGFASSGGIDRVEEVLNLQLPDLHRAITDRDFQEIQWAMAPIIYSCTQANERRMRVRRMLAGTAMVYGASRCAFGGCSTIFGPRQEILILKIGTG